MRARRPTVFEGVFQLLEEVTRLGIERALARDCAHRCRRATTGVPLARKLVGGIRDGQWSVGDVVFVAFGEAELVAPAGPFQRSCVYPGRHDRRQ